MTGVNQNDPELLEQLRDLHLPEPVSWWPLAPGWWIVAVALLAIIAIVLLAIFRHFYRRSQQDSVTEYLDDLYHQCAASGATAPYYDQALSLVKHAAMQSADSVHISKLSGTAWVDWMEQATNSSFQTTTRAALASRGYRRDQPLPDRRSHDEICQWIRQIKKGHADSRSDWQRRLNVPGVNRA